MNITQKDIDRFWLHVDKSGECWIWIGSIMNNGYGEIGISHNKKHRNVSTHRFSWIISHGAIPDKKYICHTCDNKSCVNPDHLYVGTHSDNIRDAVIRNRIASGKRQGAYTHPEKVRRGETHSLVKLTESQVIEIRNSRNIKQRKLAIEYGVHFSTICDILRRKTWKHI